MLTRYTVQSGDTISKIALKFETDVSEIIKANPEVNQVHVIYPGQQLSIPEQYTIKSFEKSVIALTNQFRQSRGLPRLTLNKKLSSVARIKAEDMRDKNYAQHTSPTFGSPYEMMTIFGIKFKSAAENIAGGQSAPFEVVNAWINNHEHRDNILSPNISQIGVGYAQGGEYGHYWSQLFID